MAQDDSYRRGRHVVSALHVHLVFVTKYRHGVLDTAMLDRCRQIMSEVCDDFGATLAEFNGEDDHVHLLVHYPPKISVSALVNSIKGVSARRLRTEFTERVNQHSMRGHFWSPSYFAGSVDGAPLSLVHQYIERQRHPA
ncbi:MULTISPECIES: IS200/IS605 family transposase [Protofrankia]|uniref:Cytosine methyltransferase n=1 Tax=Protofrankia coriariae TaxID=1562887 RepID=A0ABR5EZ49_9ACTN|nr:MULTISPECIES: IS200/IS605 family transposase [Protofrankia]KLL09735.1 cytosine methyltransferase [Protofrankia coriariae]ONH35257.1 IS200/IS605 family transposase [Protofrankia sp. BMG5.30]